MGKGNTKLTGESKYSFSSHQSYSIAEILAAGGATAFANKMGKRPQTIVDQLKKLPADSFLTTEEVIHALSILNEEK